MALNLNTSPYFDNFDKAKKFSRILFKPGVAVQARELTQLQTILQDTVGNFADHMFKDGARVKGASGQPLVRDFIKINDLDASSASVSNDTLINYVGDTVTGSTSGLIAKVSKTATGLDTDAVDKKTLYIEYTQGSSAGSYLHFEAGETLTVTSTDSGRNGDTFVVDNGTDTADPTRNYFGRGLDFLIEDGILYIDGYFVYHDSQEITLEKYKTIANYYVGVKFKDSKVTADDDSTLNDPATGTFNFNAPGADRYKTSTEIAKLGLSETNNDDFISLYTIEDGLLSRGDDVGDLDYYNQLGAQLAQRTKDESGNYVIRNFELSLRDHLKTSTNRGLFTSGEGGRSDYFAVGVGRGLAYVNGYRREFLSPTYVEVERANESVVEEGFTVSTTYGNYVLVDEVAGNWNIQDGALVKFGNAASNAASDNTYSIHAAPSTIIGQARVRQIRYDSGTVNAAACQYRLYLYDIRMTGGTFSDVKTIYHDDDAINGFADPVLESSKAVLKESNSNQLVFRAPFKAAKTLATDTGGTYDNNYTYQKEFSTEFTTSGTSTLTVTGTETFPYSSTPTQTQLDTEFYMVFQADVTIDSVVYKAGEPFRLTPSMITSISNTAVNMDIGTTLSAATDATIHLKVKQTDVTPTPLNALASRYVKIDTSSNEGGQYGPWNLGIANAYKIEAVYVDGSAYSESGTDYKDQFTLDNGQHENFYGHSKLIRKPSATISTQNKYIVVKLSHLEANYGGSVGTYFAIDSYPIDDTGASGIYTYEIPVFRSKKLGTFDLRDCVDFRPYVNNTASSATTMAAATENPLETFELKSVAGGYEMPIPTESYTTDAEYYLQRIDKIVLSEKGIIDVVKGAARLDPRAPVSPVTAMELGEITVPPYPSLSPYVGKISGRKDLACRVSAKQNRRYTMADIGAIEKRINRLEYYTSLNLLEKDTENLVITDAAGNNRFKNGIFIHNFADHNLSNLRDPDFSAAVDTRRKFLTSNFFEEQIDVIYDSTNSTGVQKTGNLLTLPYTLVDEQRNINASKFRNCIGSLLFDYKGDMELYPQSDNFVNMEDGGDVVVENSAIGQALEDFADQLNNAGIVNGVETTMTGSVPSTSTIEFGGSAGGSDVLAAATAGGQFQMESSASVEFNASMSQVVESSQLQQSVDTLTIESTGSSTLTQDMGDRIVDVGFSPFMRSQNVTFHATRLKPNTRVYAFFDGDAVSDHCRALTYASFTSKLASGVDNFWSDFNETTNAFGSALVTDSEGRLAAQFRIPSDTYRIGEKILRLTDDPQDREGFTTTSTESTYSSFGLDAVSQGSIFSTQVPSFATGTQSGNPQVIGSLVTNVRVEDVTSNVDISVDSTVTQWPTIVDPTPPTPPPVTEPPAPIPQFPFLGPLITDPTAQTFTVMQKEGMFVPKVDLYFRSKSSTNGITIQIREVINGYPGMRVVPYGSKYLSPSDVSVSTTAGDGTVTFAATGVTFDSPLFLEGGREYCIVTLPQANDPNYEVWVSELGQNKVGTTERIVAEDVSGGVLFVSSNNKTWNAFQAEDMMHRIYRCEFNTTTDGVAKFTNGPIDYLKMSDYTSGAFAAGDALHAFDITLDNGGSGHAVNDIVTFAGFGNGTGLKLKVTSESSGAVTGFSIDSMGSGFTADGTDVAQSATTGSGTGFIVDVVTKTGAVERYSKLNDVARTQLTKSDFDVSDIISNGTTQGTLQALEDKKINKIQLNFGEMILPQTKINHEYAGTASSGVSTKGTTYRKLIKLEQQITTKEYAVYSKSNEDANLSGNKSFNNTATMTTSSKFLSPVIDLSRCGFIATQNKINNDSTNEDANNSGDALAKYISKTVRLSDGQEAEDLKLFLDQNTPIGSSVEVYGKFLAAEDDADFRSELEWFKLKEESVSDNLGLSQTQFIEHKYTIDTANLNGSDQLEYAVDRVNATTISAGGSGYTTPPTVTFSGGTAIRQAKGVAVLSSGAVASIVITDPGRYATGSAAPTITISAGGGSGATATATLGATTYTTFKEFAIKIVMLTDNTSNVPRCKNLRAIALQV